jgi:hypothetical protein
VTYQGGISGEPTKPEIWVQSKVMGSSERPEVPPNIWFTTTLFGAIQVAKAKTLRNLAKKPGIQ